MSVMLTVRDEMTSAVMRSFVAGALVKPEDSIVHSLAVELSHSGQDLQVSMYLDYTEGPMEAVT